MRNRRFWVRIVLVLLAIALVVGWALFHGHDKHDTKASSSRSPLGEQTVMQRFVPKGCNAHCPTVEVSTLHFEEAPQLSARVQAQLLSMARLDGDHAAKPAAGYAQFAHALFRANAAMQHDNPGTAPYSARFKARIESRHDGLMIVRLDADSFLGGAHGMPVTDYMVIQEGGPKIVSLKDMLEPGKHAAFEARLRAVHKRWAVRQSLDVGNWPFEASDNVAPLSKALAVTYQAYDIAPYAMGQPTLRIPYDQLRGILRPRFIPGGH